MMKFTNEIGKTILAVGFVFWGISPAQAATTAQFLDAAKSDYQTISDYLTGKFAKNLGMFNTLGWNTAPTVLGLENSREVEFSLGGGAQFISFPDIQTLPLSALAVDSNVKVPSTVPAPIPVASLRVGLTNGLDIGFRYTYLPDISLPDIGFLAHFMGCGVDLRYCLFEGSELPSVSVGVSWDTLNGGFTVATDVGQTSTYQGSSVALSGKTNYSLNWNIKSFGSRLMLGKNLGRLYPFCAVGFERHSGWVSSATIANVATTVDSSSDARVITVTSSGAPDILEPKFVLGFDMGEGFHWGVTGESNGTDLAACTAFRAQF
jgi:hypothetical protein